MTSPTIVPPQISTPLRPYFPTVYNGVGPSCPVRAPSIFYAPSPCIYDGPLSEGENRLSCHVGECPRGEAQSSILQNKDCSAHDAQFSHPNQRLNDSEKQRTREWEGELLQGSKGELEEVKLGARVE
ncbi:hypothetical protein CDAR_461921 [Caerostris darwini]|uniref:Uncharacterized protein n=1 Tax=Caerostris darwini TaxID=1538125 RepID=A0AAV4T807_9ARAC|nr:hypothetical protein CDAR_461921 [Caerostris darwini]